MRIDSLSSAVVNFKAAETAASVQYAVAARVLDLEKSNGAAALALIQSANQQFEQAVEQVAAATAQFLDVTV